MTVRQHIASLSLAFLASTALAQAQAPAQAPAAAPAQDKTPGSGPSPYTDCGIGAALFTETKWAAVTSNVIWDLGATALTSATASPQTCSGKKAQTALFIRDSYDQLVEQTAAGRGDHLSTALTMFGCAPTQQAVAVQQVRSAMSQLVGAPGYADRAPMEKVTSYYSVMEQAARQTCAA